MCCNRKYTSEYIADRVGVVGRVGRCSVLILYRPPRNTPKSKHFVFNTEHYDVLDLYLEGTWFESR